jgi:hypothetical protein
MTAKEKHKKRIEKAILKKNGGCDCTKYDRGFIIKRGGLFRCRKNHKWG